MAGAVPSNLTELAQLNIQNYAIKKNYGAQGLVLS
jgi:hypothetical protein